MDFKYLGKINSPEELKKLNNKEAELLCEEIREELINTVSQNGGHLASNLGIVELTVALHRVFSSPEDPIIFDVGHQCYPHKMLTGRYDRFRTIRTEGGLSGFMRPDESEHDPFVTGHASNSLAAAYGIYNAKKLQGKDCFGVAVIGDGAMTGGLALEALNNIGASSKNFIVVLNDNKMSISGNVGSVSAHLSKIRTKPGYYVFKGLTQRALRKIPLIGRGLYSFASKLKRALKNVIYRDSLFEGLGFKYLGPVDGHDLEELENVLQIAKSLDKPCIVHTMTVKGKGFALAENEPSDYHGVSAFDINNGVIKANTDFSQICGKTLCELAEKDGKICAITAAMGSSTGLSEFSERYPERFFDVGIAEEYATTFAAGLAKGGMKPYFAVYSTFLQRAYDEIIHDTAIEGLPVRFLVDRSGIVGEDGETHQGVFDVAFLTSIPGMTIYSPASYKELEGLIRTSADSDKMIAIRYPRGKEEISFDFSKADFTVFKNEGKIAVVSYGRLSSDMLKAQSAFNSKGIKVDFIKLNKIFPISEKLIDTLSQYKKLLFFEEGIKNGSVSEHIAARLGRPCRITAIEEEFIKGMSVKAALKLNHLDLASIIEIIESEI